MTARKPVATPDTPIHEILSSAMKERIKEGIEEFNAQPEPDIYMVFVWPERNWYQAIAGYDWMKIYEKPARDLIAEARKECPYPGDSTAQAVLGDAANGLAYLVINGIEDHARMGGLIHVVVTEMGARYIAVYCKDRPEGATVDLRKMPPGVKSVADARAWIESLPVVQRIREHHISQAATYIRNQKKD